MSMYGLAGRRILMIEDNPGDAELIQDLLLEDAEVPGSVTHVTELGAARRWLDVNRADAVLLDLHLPDSSGADSVTSLRAMVPNTPIVVLTGQEDHESAFDCIVAGAQDYLPKSELRGQALRRAVGYAIARIGEAEQRQRAETLKETMAAIVECSSDAIVSASLEGIVTSWNQGAERTFGFTAAEAIGRPVVDLIRTPDAGARLDQELRVLALRRGVDQIEPVEVVRLRRDGAPRVLSIVSSALRNGAGEIVGVAGICRDITEHKQRDEELQQRNEELQLRDRRMRALAAHLTAIREAERTRISREVHDVLGQLLAGVKMDLRWLDRRLSSGQIDTAAWRARLGQAEQLADQTMAAVQRIALELRPSVLDSLGLQPAVRDEARRFEARSGVRTFVEINGSASPPAPVATALFRILQELLTNVARHAQAASASIRLVDDGTAWILEVRDDGRGMPHDAWDSPTALGLLGMRERAEAIGGSFRIGPRPDGGTLATVRVPT